MTATSRATLTEALSQFDAYMQIIGGCRDGACHIVKASSGHANGGCTCHRDPVKMQRYINATERLRAAIADLDAGGKG
jgi:hypothetical protein